MFANVERERERERDWCRHIKVNSPSVDRQVEGEREREREMCVLNEFRQFLLLFFLLWKLVYVFQSLCRSLQKKKSDRMRCLAVSILEYNIN